MQRAAERAGSRAWRALALAVLVGSSPVAGATIQRECDDEPVFDGVACVYQANRRASRTVVLVHGINGSALNDWQGQMEALSKTYHVIAVDLPGFGASSRGNELYSPEAYARFLRYVTERYAKKPPYFLVGHSMGGAVALRYAAAYPADVERLVLIDVAGILHRVAFTKELVGEWVEKKTGREGSFIERAAGKVLEKFDGIASRFGDMLADETWRQRALDGEPSEIAGMALLDDDFSEVLPAVRAPTLIIWGNNDGIAPLRTGWTLAARLPAARLEVLPDVGHVPMQDAPAKLNELLTSYFSAPDGSLPPARAPLVLDAPRSQRIGRCERGKGTLNFTGEWARIELQHCSGVVIHDARIGQLEMYESRVSILNSTLVGERPMVVAGSEVQMTGGAVSGKVAIEAHGSRLDLAGVQVTGSESALIAPRASKVTLSVSEIQSPHGAGPNHTYVVVTPERPL